MRIGTRVYCNDGMSRRKFRGKTGLIDAGQKGEEKRWAASFER
jgi:hypothetical protein